MTKALLADLLNFFSPTTSRSVMDRLEVQHKRALKALHKVAERHRDRARLTGMVIRDLIREQANDENEVAVAREHISKLTKGG